MEKVLSGVRVLDFTDALAGPFCTRYLADCGAEVISIERPGGKVARATPYFFRGQSVDYMYNHCGKKSIGIDLKKSGAHDLVMKLAKACDVIVENNRPGVMKELGLEYGAFQAVNPSVIMCSISGWGQAGPYAEYMGADLSLQASSGILDLTGDPGKRPTLVGFPVTDILSGLNAFGAICAALYRRTVTGKGDYIDIAMADCAFATLHQAAAVHLLTEGKEENQRAGSFNNDLSAWGVFKGRDGYIVLSAQTKIGWDRLTELMEKPELATDPRFNTRENRVKNNKEVVKIVERWLRKFEKVADVAALLQSYRIQAMPVMSVAKIIEENPQFKLREMLKELDHATLGKVKFMNSPLKFTQFKASVDEPPPAAAGEHTDEVLRGLLNLNDDEITYLKKEGIVFSGK